MQGTEASVMECHETVDAFVCKLEYRKIKLVKGDLELFPSLMKQSHGSLADGLVRQFTHHMEKLQEEITSQF